MVKVSSKSAIAADSRILRWMSLHMSPLVRNPLYSARGEIDDWLNSENAVCMMHSQCISLSRPVSVDCSFFAFRPLTWQKREDTIFSFSSGGGLHAASLCPAFAISRWRFWSRISSRYRRRRETAEKKRIKRAFRFPTAFGFRRDWKVMSVKGYIAASPFWQRATRRPILFILSQFAKTFVTSFPSAIRERYPLNWILLHLFEMVWRFGCFKFSLIKRVFQILYSFVFKNFCILSLLHSYFWIKTRLKLTRRVIVINLRYQELLTYKWNNLKLCT